jgi:hypothetical protein
VPPLEGAPVEIRILPGLRDEYGPAHAGSFIHPRLIHLNSALLANPSELQRIFVHEIFHFAWVRLGNPRRRLYEYLVCREIREGTAGELGWSSEWRKMALTPGDVRERSRRWREYVCESFCDTAAWRFSGVRRHAEYTLAAAARRTRTRWFDRTGLTSGVWI